jgi:hypothetical protein
MEKEKKGGTTVMKGRQKFTKSISPHRAGGAFLGGLRGNGRRCGPGGGYLSSEGGADRGGEGAFEGERYPGEIILTVSVHIKKALPDGLAGGAFFMSNGYVDVLGMVR